MDNVKEIRSAHFIGIGGAGMSGIALVLHERGCKVTGSDLKSSNYVRKLEDAGIEVHIGHEAPTIDAVAPEVVVISTAIPETNPELIRARELGIPIWPRAKMLSYLSLDTVTVAVAGTHGKTTTSSMVASMLDTMGLDPTFLIGGIVEGYGTNGRNGSGGLFVCEADESDGSFLFLDPDVVVVTNIEEDHLDYYGSLANIEKTFCKFMGLVGDAGTIVVYGDSDHLVELARSTGRRVVTYGFNLGCDYRCTPGQSHGIQSAATVKVPSGKIVSFTIQANPGEHNLANATAAIAVADVLGTDVERAAEALSKFKGARRRFTHVGDVDGRGGVQARLQPHRVRLPAAPLLAHAGAREAVGARLRQGGHPARHRRVLRRRDAHPGRLGQDRRELRQARGRLQARGLRPQRAHAG